MNAFSKIGLIPVGDDIFSESEQALSRPQWSETDRVLQAEMANKGTGTEDAKSRKKKRSEK